MDKYMKYRVRIHNYSYSSEETQSYFMNKNDAIEHYEKNKNSKFFIVLEEDINGNWVALK